MINLILWYVICSELGFLIGREVRPAWLSLVAVLLLAPVGWVLSWAGALGHPSDTLPATLLLLAFVVIEAPWFLWCNNRTYKEQMAAVHWALLSGDWENKIVLVNQVPYGAHLWRRITFRDPWAIYPPEVARAMRVRALIKTSSMGPK